MSLLRKIELGEEGILITLELTKEEHDAIAPDSKEFVVLAADKLNYILTTGKLGNGNRVMVPSKFLRSNDVHILRKNVKASIINTGEKKFLVIELEDKKTGIPVFGED